jgi:hypothetical protein
LDKPEERDIELLFKNPESLTFEQREGIRLWIQKDPQIKAIAGWYREFYRHLYRVEQSKINHCDIPAVIELNNYEIHKKPIQKFVLAAQTAAALEKPPKSIKTLYSEDQNTLLRILYDHKKRQTRLHVISSYLADDDIVLLETDTGKILTSSPGNVIDIPEPVLSRNVIFEWERCLVHIPICRINFYRDQNTGAVTFSAGKSFDEFILKELKINIHQERIFILLPEPEISLKPGMAILNTGTKTYFNTLIDNSFEIPIGRLTETTSQVFLYT